MTTAALNRVCCKFCEGVRRFCRGMMLRMEIVGMARACSELCHLGRYAEAQKLCRRKMRLDTILKDK